MKKRERGGVHQNKGGTVKNRKKKKDMKAGAGNRREEAWESNPPPLYAE